MFKEIVPAHILDIVPYKPGKPVSEVKRELGLEQVIKLASNENPLGPSPMALEAVRNALQSVHYYPEDSGFYLRQKLAANLGTDINRIFLGNGSSEIIVNFGRAFLRPGDEILTSETSFVMYYLCGAYLGNPVVKMPMRDWRYDLESMAAAITPATRLIFIANPNNPTGTFFGRDEWERFMKRVPPNVLVVLDEAYCEYVEEPDYPDGMDYLAHYSNLVVLRTFSKIYGLAGMRVGYAVADPEIIDILYRVKLPFNANSMAQVAALAALDDHEFVARSRRVNQDGLRYLHDFLAAGQYQYVPSVGNFVMILLPVEGGIVFTEMQKRGVIVRPLKGFGVENAIRVTVGTDAENAMFTKHFRDVMAGINARV